MLQFPAFRQTYNYDCGALALEAILAFYGFDLKEGDVMQKAGTTKNGTPINGIKKAAKAYGLKVKSKKMTVDEVKKYIDKNIPVLIPLQAWTNKPTHPNWEEDWIDGHYVVAIGYDNKKFYFEDPSSNIRDFLTYDEFEKRWHDIGSDKTIYDCLGIIIYGKRRLYNPKKIIHMD